MHVQLSAQLGECTIQQNRPSAQWKQSIAYKMFCNFNYLNFSTSVNVTQFNLLMLFFSVWPLFTGITHARLQFSVVAFHFVFAWFFLRALHFCSLYLLFALSSYQSLATDCELYKIKYKQKKWHRIQKCNVRARQALNVLTLKSVCKYTKKHRNTNKTKEV